MWTSRGGSEDAPTPEPLIRLRGVTKSYETGRGPFLALRDVDLDVPAGQFVAIVGLTETLADRLCSRTTLLMIDNCEHLLDAWRG
jgi:ABC-type nitrate/sulfonate/bicarbonate transport system ATPase subunit